MRLSGDPERGARSFAELCLVLRNLSYALEDTADTELPVHAPGLAGTLQSVQGVLDAAIGELDDIGHACRSCSEKGACNLRLTLHASCCREGRRVSLDRGRN